MASKLSILAFSGALLSVLLIQPVGCTSDVLDTRQTANPNGPPPGWTPVGCFTDRGAARTLMAQMLDNTVSMTPALCLNFCSQFTPGYGFAGVEFGQQCWCDGVIQLTANATDDSECNIPCSGDDTLLCGGSSRIMVFTDGTPGPKITTVAVNLEHTLAAWQYVGCYSDSGGNRTLERMVAGQMDANSCGPVACQSAFPNSAIKVLAADAPSDALPNLFAGSEFGGECWCGPEIASTAQLLPDIACASMGCFGVNDQACGGPFVMAVYQFNPLLFISDEEVVNCFDDELPGQFHLNAVFVDDPSTSVPITMVSLEVFNVGNAENPDFITMAGILSYCPTCASITFASGLFNMAVVMTPETAINNLTVVHPAGTVNFVEITDTQVLFLGYCAGPSILHPELVQMTTQEVHRNLPITAPPGIVLNDFIAFSLCSNLTANGRLDVVYKILTFQPGYNLTNCRDVVLEVDFIST